MHSIALMTFDAESMAPRNDFYAQSLNNKQTLKLHENLLTEFTKSEEIPTNESLFQLSVYLNVLSTTKWGTYMIRHHFMALTPFKLLSRNIEVNSNERKEKFIKSVIAELNLREIVIGKEKSLTAVSSLDDRGSSEIILSDQDLVFNFTCRMDFPCLPYNIYPIDAILYYKDAAISYLYLDSKTDFMRDRIELGYTRQHKLKMFLYQSFNSNVKLFHVNLLTCESMKHDEIEIKRICDQVMSLIS